MLSGCCAVVQLVSGDRWVRMVSRGWPGLAALPPLLLLVGASGGTSAYFADFGTLGGRPQEPTCVDIPPSMGLCSGIDYTKMRLPNLLEHDTLKEAEQQASYWVPLLNLRCHPNTQLFLCSLFTPVCLESPIYPCRSLCEAVRSGCEGRMRTYSFPWPEMLNCDNFPLDNDMCITEQHAAAPDPEVVPDGACPACHPAETYENILDNFCRADLVVKVRVRRQRQRQLLVKKSRRVYKNRVGGDGEGRRFSLTEEAACCPRLASARKPLLVMARRGPAPHHHYIPTFVMPIKKSRALRQAMKMFRSGLNCSDPNLITNNLEPTALSREPGGGRTPPTPVTSPPRTTEAGTRRRGGNDRRRLCTKKCRRNCNKRCRADHGQTCTDDCRQTCKQECRKKGARSRNRGAGRRRGNGSRRGQRRPSPTGTRIPPQRPQDLPSDIVDFDAPRAEVEPAAEEASPPRQSQ